MAQSGQQFTFPPLHGFAPFFTLQRNAQTLDSQLKAWTKLVIDYCQVYRVFILDVDGAWIQSTGDVGRRLFRNESIDRELSAEAQRQVFKALVDQGSAKWDPPLKSGRSKSTSTAGAVGDRILVFWKKPEEWAELIYSWVASTGQNGSIMTFFELTEGELVQDQEFRQLPIQILLPALQSLENQGKARIFEGTEGVGDSATGVKFA